MILGYCFDLDGTLLDSEIVWVEAIQQYITAEGAAITRAEADALVYGRSWHDIHKEIVSAHPTLDMPVKAMEECLAPYFAALLESRDVRIHSSITVLKHLAEEAPVCIVSGSSRATIADAIRTMDISAEVRFFLGAEDYSPGKPDPVCYTMAAHQLGLAPADCLVFEDSEAGVRSAKAAGMQCVALVSPNAPKQDISTADLILHDLADFDPADW